MFEFNILTGGLLLLFLWGIYAATSMILVYNTTKKDYAFAEELQNGTVKTSNGTFKYFFIFFICFIFKRIRLIPPVFDIILYVLAGIDVITVIWSIIKGITMICNLRKNSSNLPDTEKTLVKMTIGSSIINMGHFIIQVIGLLVISIYS